MYYSECKHVKHLGLESFMIKGAGQLEKFWAKAAKEARRNQKVPVIFARQNGWPILVISRDNAFALQNCEPGICIGSRNIGIWKLDRLLACNWWT